MTKQLDKQQKIQQTAIPKLSTQEFNYELDVRQVAQQLAGKIKYH
ncbi:hypothetical protein [uncultured Nostoc sp.]|nr:hypothetical protein [uncultured Nostoc sp.]